MPCRYDPTPDELRAEEERKKKKRKAAVKTLKTKVRTPLLKKLDEATRLLCGLCTKIEKDFWSRHLLLKNKELRAWWEKHKEADFKRVAHESFLKRYPTAKVLCAVCNEKAVGIAPISICGAPKVKHSLCQCHLDAAADDNVDTFLRGRPAKS